jgi:hypothetical protein
MNNATCDFSRIRTVTGRCRGRKRAENADFGFWTLWIGYLLEWKPLQVFIQIRALCRHRYTRQRNEAMKINQGKRTGNASRQVPLEHRQWCLILEGNIFSRTWCMMFGRYEKAFQQNLTRPSLGQLLTYPNPKNSLDILNRINPSPFGFQTSLMQFYVIHTVHIFIINTRINGRTS